MCGIAGFLGDFSPELLDRMNAVQAHRGPDDHGTWYSRPDRVGLAHRRLSIIDVSASGHQPMRDDDGHTTIVYNGELYNFRELRTELQADGFRFRGGSDTEVLLNLYLRDGHGMLDRLNGIFAFAIWDHRDRSLFVARDGLGVKPLYHAATPRGFLFASEIKALVRDDGLDRAIDPVAVQHHLAYLWCPAPRTMLRAVRKLRPGHALVVRNGEIERQWSFYELPTAAAASVDPREAADLVRDAVRTAVERQMVADVPVGAFLSGGLDSSSVAWFAARAAVDRTLQCFTIGFRDDAFRREGYAEDLPYARKAAAAIGVDLHTVEVGPEITDALDDVVYHLDEPQADPAPIHVLLISRLARQHGIPVLLSGAGGDDIFSGYRRHLALHREAAWSWLPRPARAAMAAAARRLPVGSPLGRRVRKAFQFADQDGDRRLASYFLWMTAGDLATLYGPAIRDDLRGVDVLAPMMDTLATLPDSATPLDRMLHLEVKHFLADHNLNYTDKMGMATGVEIRVPLLDPDLVGLAARLPDSVKQRGTEGKWVFKKAMESVLPRDIVYRPKTGFGAPIRMWLRGPLRPRVEELLSPSALATRGLFDPTAVTRLIEADRHGRIDAAYTIYAILCIEMWCRRFLDAA